MRSFAFLVVLALGIPLGQAHAPLAHDDFDQPLLWETSGDARLECDPECGLILDPLVGGGPVPATGSAGRILPGPGQAGGRVSWTFVGSTTGGWTDVDLRLSLAEGTPVATVIDVSHTEDMRNWVTGEYLGNNGMSLSVGATRIPGFATWDPAVPQRVEVVIDGSGVAVGIAPVNGGAPMVWSPTVPLPLPGGATMSVEIEARSFGDGPSRATYRFDDLDVVLDRSLRAG